MRNLILAALLACTGPLVANAASDFPSKPIKIIVNGSAGAGTESLTRTLADHLKKYISQPVVVVNLPGGGGLTGTSAVQEAAPDCYTAGYLAMPHLVAQNASGLTKMTLDDFTMLAQLVDDPNVVAVKADAPWKTFNDLVEQAKKDPASLKWADSGYIGDDWLVIADLGRRLSVSLKAIHYPGAAEQNAALLGGQMNVKVGNIGDTKQHVESGAMRILAVATEARDPRYPDVPTLKELGMDIVASVPRGIVYPKGTPDECVQILGGAIKKVSEDPDYVKALANQGLAPEVRVGAEHRAYLEDRWARASDVIKAMGELK
jgi:tripartite-type tricarboxylate transporter receptor subunit TctC